MIVNFCQLYANSSHILIRPFSSCTGNYLFSYSLIRDKCIKTIFYNISKCISSVAFKNINHYNKLNLNKSLVHIKKRNCNSHSKSENLFYECKNITKLENGVRLNHCSMNYNLLNKINFYRQVNNKINCNLKNILRSYVKYFYYLKNKNLSTMSNDILKLNLILKSKIKKKVNKKKRKLSLLLAGGCLSCKRSKRDEEKLTEEAEELDINQTNKDYGIEKNTCSTFEIDEKLRNDKVKNIILKDDTEATTSSVSESIANESLKQISSKKIEEKNMLVTELPFGNDLCTGSNDDVNDFGSDLLGERQKKKKKVKQKDKKLLIKERTKSHKKRPNHFVAIQVSNPEIKGAIKNIQNHIIQKENILKSTLINVKTLHITLLVFHISNNEELERACSALSNAFEVLKDDLSINPLELTFEGIDHFNNKVIFIKIADDALERLTYVTEEVIKSFESCDIDITDKKKFAPHLTILKLSKDSRLWKKGIKKVECCLYDEFKDEQFGTEIVKGLQLLEMKRKDDTGYYHCCKEFLFENSKYSKNECSEESEAKIGESPKVVLRKEKENVRKKISSLTETQLKRL